MTLLRRDLLLGAVCVAGSAAALALTPRRRVSLMRGQSLADITPAAFGAWTGRDVGDLVAPKVAGTLESRLYGESVQRIYSRDDGGSQIMVLLAHGDTQSNELQLHRPEVCYPAFGFQISSSQPDMLQLTPQATLPARRLVAVAPDRRENIVYWTRLGEYLPLSEGEQRLDRVRTALQGVIADGLLARISLVEDDAFGAFRVLGEFARALIGAIRPPDRQAFLGTSLARALNGT
jgi:EpsI family protein